MARLPPVRCPQCKKKYRLAASFENKQVVCKRCKHKFLVQSGDSVSVPPADGEGASPFDSLDVEGLLNAPTSGLEKSKLSSKRRSQGKRRKGAAPNPPAPAQAKTVRKSARQEEQADPDEERESNDPDPDLIEEELEFAWAKKKKDKKQAADEKRMAEAELAKSYSGSDNKDEELDEEELAIYRAVTRQNRMKNLIWGAIAAIVAISISGFYAKQEYQLLGKPLSQAERDWLTERGFVLEASHIEKFRGDDDGAAVLVAAGRSFADVDQFGLTPKDAGGNGNNVLGGGRNARPGGGPNGRNGFADKRRGGGQPNRRDNRKLDPLPKVDFDTNADVSTLATAPVGSAQQIPFPGYTVATFSPRGHAYVAGSKFIKGVSVDGDVFDQRSLRPTQTVTAIVATPDGRYVIFGDDRGVVQAYQVDGKGRLSSSWKLRHIHRDKIIRLRVSNDSKQLVVYSADGRLTIWDLEKQLIELNLSDLVPEVRLLSFQLTDDAILIGSGEGLRKIQLGQSTVDVVSFDKRYRLLAADRSEGDIVVSDGKTISAIDATSKRTKWGKTIRIADQARIEFSPDGETAFYHDGGRDVLHFELSSGRVLQQYGDDRLKFVNRVAASFDGEKLLAFGDRGTVLIFKIKDAKTVAMPQLKAPLAAPDRDYPPSINHDDAEITVLASARVSNENVSAVCLSDSGFLIAAVKGRTIVYDWTTDRTVYERFDSGQDKVTTMTTIGNKLVQGRASGMVEVAELESDGKLGRFKDVSGHIDPVKFFAPIPNTTLIASVTESGHTRVWDLWDAETNETAYVGKPIDSSVQSVVVDRRSDLLLAAGNELATLDYKTGGVKRKKGEVRVRNVTILPDGKRLAFFDRTKLNLATTSRGEINLSIELPRGAASVSFSPNSKLAFLFADERVIVYRLRGGKEIHNFPIASRSNSKTEMVFSADRKFMMPFHRGGKGNFQIYATPSP